MTALAGLTVREAIGPGAPPGLQAAAALCGRVLAEMGAAVTCTPPGPGLTETEVRFLHAGKRAEPSGTVADVVITDAAIPPAARLLTVILSMDAAGTAQQSEFTIEARSGLLDIVGEPDRAPLRLAGHQTGYAAGLAAFTAIMAALAAPAAAPQVVQVNLLDTAIWLNWKSLVVAARSGKAPKRAGHTVEWPVLPCADGHVALVHRPPDWARLRQALPDPALEEDRFQTVSGRHQHRAALNAVLARQVAGLTRAELRALALRHKLPFGAVWQPSELLDDPHVQARDAIAPVPGGGVPRLPVLWNGHRPLAGQGGPPRAWPAAAASGQAPLAGCRVLDLGIITAGAATSALLADLGAEVIKIESAAYPDPFRDWTSEPQPDPANDLPPFFRATNRNKRALGLDLKQPAGRDAFLRLAASSDIVVENFSRGVLPRLGIGYDALRAVRPGIILASISSQGETGPDAAYVSFGSTLEAVGGLAAGTGYAGGAPVVTGSALNYPDQVVALFAAGVIVAAWSVRQRDGTGAHLDLSQRELTSFLSGEAFLAGPRAPQGNAQPPYAVQDCLLCQDGAWIAVSLMPEDIGRVRTVDPAGDLAAWVATRPAAEAVSALRQAGLIAAQVLDARGVLTGMGQDWHEAMQRLRDGDLVKGVPFRLGAAAAALHAPARTLGADSRAVLHQAGFSAEEIEALVTAGVVQPAGPQDRADAVQTETGAPTLGRTVHRRYGLNCCM